MPAALDGTSPTARAANIAFERGSSRPLGEWTVRGLHEALATQIASLPGVNAETPVLDIGCGTGAWLERLAANGFRNLTGVDRNSSEFAAIHATCSEVNIDTDNFEMGDRRFGLITAIEVVEHLENPGRLFAVIARYLSDDGLFLMTTPNVHSLICRVKFLIKGDLRQFDDKGDPTHIYPVFLPCLYRILSRHGLAVVQKSCYPSQGKTMISRPIARVAAAILSTILRDDDPGDTLCLLIAKAPEPVASRAGNSAASA